LVHFYPPKIIVRCLPDNASPPVFTERGRADFDEDGAAQVVFGSNGKGTVTIAQQEK
jgi:hypothetical protein